MSNYETSKTINSSEEEFELRRGPWTLEEDNLLIHFISCHGEGRWNWLAKCAGLKRTGKSCRLRWLNYLKPDTKRGNLTPHEQLLILELHSKWGNRWSKIAQHLPGRTDNEIKNYWRTRVQKQARQLKVDANSKTFLDVIKCYWMPRLLDKMKQTSIDISTIENQDSIDATSSLPTITTNHMIISPGSLSVARDHNNHMDKSNLLNFPAIEDNQGPYQNDCNYYFDSTNYSEDYIGHDQQDISLSEYLMTETDWYNNDHEMVGSIWNNDDELWKL